MVVLRGGGLLGIGAATRPGPITASPEKVCKPFKGSKHYAGCEDALNKAVDQLNEAMRRPAR